MPKKPFTKEILSSTLQTNIPYLAAIIWELWDDGTDSYIDLVNQLNNTFKQRASGNNCSSPTSMSTFGSEKVVTSSMDNTQIKLIINTLKLGDCLTKQHLSVINKIFAHNTPLDVAKKAVKLQKVGRLLISDNIEQALCNEINEMRIEDY